MRSWLALSLLALLACGNLGAVSGQVDDDADDEYEAVDTYQALLVVHKQCLLGPSGVPSSPGSSVYPVVVQGKNVTVEAILHNGGTR